MIRLKNYFVWLAAAIIAVCGLTACQDDIDAPAVNIPEAKDKPNTTILELKKAFWQDAVNYADTIGVKEDGSHYIISGRVVSSDEAGNVFKSLVIQDETAAIAISINSYNLYLKYRRGQEIVLDLTGMYIGKYNGLVQLGMPEWYANGNCWEISFMSPQNFADHAQLNGLPDIAKIDTLQINSFSELPSNPDGLCEYQSRLVRFNNVKFTNGGKETFSTYHSSGVNQTIEDTDGQSLNVRTSGYANFWNRTLPEGRLDLVCILSYYGTSGWQLTLIDYEGCMNVGNPTEAQGTRNNPWTIDQAVALETAGTKASGWITGYIVGAVAPEVTEVKSNDDVEWSSTPVLGNTLVIGQTPDTRDINNAIVIELPEGSSLMTYGNLVNNPTVYGKQIWLKGNLAKYMGTFGLTGNNGTTEEYQIEGVTPGDQGIVNGDGQKNTPWSANQVIAGQGSGTTAWVKGYIVGSSAGKTAAEFTPTATGASQSNIFIANTPDETDYTKCVPVQLPANTDARTSLNLATNPSNLGKAVSVLGSLEKYFGQPGVKSVSEFSLEGGITPPTPPTPANPVTSIDETFPTTTIPTGWTQAQLAGNKAWYVATFDNNNYAAMTGYKGTAPFDQWLITPPVDMSKVADKKLSFDSQVNGYGSTTTTFEVFVMTSDNPSMSTNTKLNPKLAVAPASGYSGFVNSGEIDLSAFTGIIYIGFRYSATADANFATWCIDNVKLNAGGDTPTPPTPPTPSGDYKGDFNSFNGGAAKASPYGTYTNATGWTANNAIILGGGDNDSNPYFTFIGASGTLAPTIKGTKGAEGSIVSPVLTGGIKTLTFSYGFAFNESKAGFTVNVKDASGNVIKTQTVTCDPVTTKTAFTFTMDVNYSGSFTIEIVNDGLSGATSGNKDRLSVWNLTWTV